ACARPALDGGPAVTLTCNTEFVGAGRFGTPVDGTGEIIRAARRTIFLRGLVTQEGETLCIWSGVLRKFGRRP
ncbi:MAG: hotdog domain-containing protein, partial [Pseudomonadota bacterium]